MIFSRDNAARYRSLFEGSPAASFVISSGGAIVEVNRAGAALAQSSSVALRGVSARKWMTPGSLPIFDRFLRELFDAEGPGGLLFCEVETFGLQAASTGGHGFFRVSGTRGTGGPERLVVFSDITQSRNIEHLARVGHWTWNLSAQCGTWSDEIYRITGFDPASYALTDESLPRRYTAESLLRGDVAIKRCIAQKVPFEVDLQMRCADGSLKWVTTRGEPILGEDGRVVGLQGTIQDIDDRKLLEDELRRGQEMSHEAEAIGGLGSWVYDVESDCMRVSEGLARIAGSTLREVSLEASLSFLHPDDAPSFRDAFYRALAGDDSFSEEFRLIRESDGAERFVHAQGRIVRGAEGRPIRTYGVLHDITDRKLLEAELQKRQQIADKVEEIGRIGGWEYDSPSDAMRISPGFARILGLDKQTIPIDEVLALAHPDEPPLVELFRNGLAGGGTSLAHEYRFIRQTDGQVRTFLSQVHAMRDAAGHVYRMFGALQDITERKQVELALAEAKAQADEASRAKSMFLAAMSHEIRTPLNSVIGFANLLSDGNLDQEQRDFLRTIRSSGELLLGIVNDILDFSKLEEGKVELERIEFDLRAAVASVLQMMESMARSKGLRLHLEFPGEDIVGVDGDPTRLKQVLLNLLSNAVKFTATGSVTLRVEALPGQFRFSVIDTGIGIPADQHRRLFDVFTQADSSTTRRFGGAGLGLAISRRLVELLGGSIGVKSEVGSGSTFWFTARLPLAAKPAFDESLAALQGRRALVVDPDPQASARLTAQLQHLGLRAEAVTTSVAALSALAAATTANDPMTLVFIDPKTPGGGWKLGEAIRSQARNTVVSIVMVANNRPKGHRPEPGVHPGRVGHDGFLLKPIPPRVLANALRRLPAAQPAGAPASSVSKQKTPPSEWKGRVLVVEDNRVNQRVAAASLERLGYDVDIAQDGEEAVRLYQETVALAESSYDIILMDCHMPVMDGFAATAAIRKLEAAVSSPRRIPIVALTADVLDDGMHRCIQSGMDDFLSKPLRLDQLAATFDRWVNGAR